MPELIVEIEKRRDKARKRTSRQSSLPMSNNLTNLILFLTPRDGSSIGNGAMTGGSMYRTSSCASRTGRVLLSKSRTPAARETSPNKTRRTSGTRPSMQPEASGDGRKLSPSSPAGYKGIATTYTEVAEPAELSDNSNCNVFRRCSALISQWCGHPNARQLHCHRHLEISASMVIPI
jgi:hypothetical protein